MELDLKTGINQSQSIKQNDIYDYKIVVTQFPITPDFVVAFESCRLFENRGQS